MFLLTRNASEGMIGADLRQVQRRTEVPTKATLGLHMEPKHRALDPSLCCLIDTATARAV